MENLQLVVAQTNNADRTATLSVSVTIAGRNGEYRTNWTLPSGRLESAVLEDVIAFVGQRITQWCTCQQGIQLTLVDSGPRSVPPTAARSRAHPSRS